MAQGIPVVVGSKGHRSIALEWDSQEGDVTVANWRLSLSSLSTACRGAAGLTGFRSHPN